VKKWKYENMKVEFCRTVEKLEGIVLFN